MKAERNFIAEIDAAVASYDSHPQQLRHLTRSLRHPDTRKPCRRIEAMDLNQIREHRGIWGHTFRGTRFLQLLQRRCRERRRQKDQTT